MFRGHPSRVAHSLGALIRVSKILYSYPFKQTWETFNAQFLSRIKFNQPCTLKYDVKFNQMFFKNGNPDIVFVGDVLRLLRTHPAEDPR